MLGTTALIYTGYAIIIGLSLLGLYLDRLPFSLNKIFWIFCLFFWGIAPWLQYASGTFPFTWMHPEQDTSSFIETNKLIIACMLTFGCITYLFQKTYSGKKLIAPDYPFAPSFPKLLTILIPAVIVQLAVSPDWWMRRATENETLWGSSSLQLLADKGSKGLMLGAALIALTAFRQKRYTRTQMALITLLLICANFPTALPRYWLATMYMGLGITAFSGILARRKRLFEIVLMSGLLFVFPLLSLIRIPSEKQSRKAISFCTQDFDTYGSLQNTLRYTKEHGFQKGKQISTTLLFFIPRTYWPEKSIGSGAIVNHPRPGSDFRNYASPLPAEGYIDFGIAGALTWVGLAAIMAAWYDRKYWRDHAGSFGTLFYPAYFGLFFFMLRGDLLSSFAFSIGISASAFISFKFLQPIKTQGNKPS